MTCFFFLKCKYRTWRNTWLQTKTWKCRKMKNAKGTIFDHEFWLGDSRVLLQVTMYSHAVGMVHSKNE